MKLFVEMPEHHYNNIKSLDAVSLGRIPYKGIIMYAINAIKHGKVLEQEPKTGHWEYGYSFADGNYCKCSECKEIIKCIYPMHYCPNCGAKMVEPQETEADK